jgi:hypothetical protein
VNRWWAVVGAVVIALAGAVALSWTAGTPTGGAPALHTAGANPFCDGLHFEWGQFGQGYSATVTIDGVEDTFALSSEGERFFPWDQTVDHTWKVTTTYHGKIGQGTQTACVGTTTTTVAETTTTVCTDCTPNTVVTIPEATTTTVPGATTTTTVPDETTTVAPPAVDTPTPTTVAPILPRTR